MLTIQASDFISKTSRPIATYGDDNIFAALHATVDGSEIRIQCELVIYLGGSAYDYEMVGYELAVDDEEAIGAAVDLEHAAAKRLRDLDVRELTHDPLNWDFQAAIEKFLGQYTAPHAIAAE